MGEPQPAAPPPYHNSDKLEQLCELMRGPHKPLALLGAGVSLGSGYPSWSQLIGKFAARAEANGLNTTAPWLSLLEKSNDAPWQAEAYKDALGEADFHAIVEDTFKPAPSVQEPHATIGRMKFRHVLTTNYENTCERALAADLGSAPHVVDWCDTVRLNGFLRRLSDPGLPPHVVYLHGRNTAPADVILTESSYVKRYVQSEDARRKLLAIFLTNSVVFIGFSMDDPDLSNLMREVAARGASDEDVHFAIMPYANNDQRDAIAERMRKKFGLSTIFYHVPENSTDHGNLLVLLQYLAYGKTPPEMNPPQNDPHKGMFGRSPTCDGFRLSVTAPKEVTKGKWLRYTLVVEDSHPTSRLNKPVRFFLHPSFRKSEYTVDPKDGRATDTLTSYGAFTVGVEIPQARKTPVRLELDLANEMSLPQWFRDR